MTLRREDEIRPSGPEQKNTLSITSGAKEQLERIIISILTESELKELYKFIDDSKDTAPQRGRKVVSKVRRILTGWAVAAALFPTLGFGPMTEQRSTDDPVFADKITIVDETDQSAPNRILPDCPDLVRELTIAQDDLGSRFQEALESLVSSCVGDLVNTATSENKLPTIDAVGQRVVAYLNQLLKNLNTRSGIQQPLPHELPSAEDEASAQPMGGPQNIGDVERDAAPTTPEQSSNLGPYQLPAFDAPQDAIDYLRLTNPNNESIQNGLSFAINLPLELRGDTINSEEFEHFFTFFPDRERAHITFQLDMLVGSGKLREITEADQSAMLVFSFYEVNGQGRFVTTFAVHNQDDTLAEQFTYADDETPIGGKLASNEVSFVGLPQADLIEWARGVGIAGVAFEAGQAYILYGIWDEAQGGYVLSGFGGGMGVITIDELRERYRAMTGGDPLPKPTALPGDTRERRVNVSAAETEAQRLITQSISNSEVSEAFITYLAENAHFDESRNGYVREVNGVEQVWRPFTTKDRSDVESGWVETQFEVNVTIPKPDGSTHTVSLVVEMSPNAAEKLGIGGYHLTLDQGAEDRIKSWIIENADGILDVSKLYIQVVGDNPFNGAPHVGEVISTESALGQTKIDHNTMLIRVYGGSLSLDDLFGIKANLTSGVVYSLIAVNNNYFESDRKLSELFIVNSRSSPELIALFQILLGPDYDQPAVFIAR